MLDIEVVNGELIPSEEVLAVFKEARDIDLMKKAVEIKLEGIKEALLKAMQENGIKKVDTDYLTAVYVAPSVRKTVDTKALKEQGLYEMFTKESPVKETLKVSYKHDQYD